MINGYWAILLIVVYMDTLQTRFGTVNKKSPFVSYIFTNPFFFIRLYHYSILSYFTERKRAADPYHFLNFLKRSELSFLNVGRLRNYEIGISSKCSTSLFAKSTSGHVNLCLLFIMIVFRFPPRHWYSTPSALLLFNCPISQMFKPCFIYDIWSPRFILDSQLFSFYSRCIHHIWISHTATSGCGHCGLKL